MTKLSLTASTLSQLLGDDLDYSRGMTSFSPFYSDIGLGIGDDAGIQNLFLHYNRDTTRSLKPFLSLPHKVNGRQCTATGVTQRLDGGCVRMAFCDHNTWLVECEGVDSLQFGLSHVPECQELRCDTPTSEIRLFDCYLPKGDKRDPDPHFPFVLGVRVVAGTMKSGDGLSEPVHIEMDGTGRILLVFSARMLEVDHKMIMDRLQSASRCIEDAVSLTQSWIEQSMGTLQLDTDDKRECSILARCVHTLISNSTKAPGFLSGRIASFPSRGHYPTHFLWDSCFQNLGTELMNPALATDSLLLLTENLRPDGKMPHFLCSTWVRPDVSQPPLVGWAGLRLAQARNDVGLAARLLPALQRNTRWWLSQRMTRFGLIAALNGLETGWDDSPRFDDGPTVACDMNSYLLMQMRACAEFSSMLGDADGAKKQMDEADDFANRMVAVLFDEDAGLFWDRHVETGDPVRLKTPACFLPFLAGVPLSESIAGSSIEKVLLNPDFFFGEVPFPSVAYDENCYQPEKWWRGPTWMPVAYLMLQVLDKTGFHAEAKRAGKSLYKMLLQDGDLRELFNSKTGEGLGAYEQGWTAAICLRLHQELSEQ